MATYTVETTDEITTVNKANVKKLIAVGNYVLFINPKFKLEDLDANNFVTRFQLKASGDDESHYQIFKELLKKHSRYLAIAAFMNTASHIMNSSDAKIKTQTKWSLDSQKVPHLMDENQWEVQKNSLKREIDDLKKKLKKQDEIVINKGSNQYTINEIDEVVNVIFRQFLIFEGDSTPLNKKPISAPK